MAQEVFSAVLTAMIERVQAMSPDEATALGTAWTSQEGVTFDPASYLGGWWHEIPHLQNQALQIAWQQVEDDAAAAGRADELDAAIAAEKAAEAAVRWHSIDPLAKAGAVEAARAAVLAVGVRDAIPNDAYQLLVGPWTTTFGEI